MAKETRDKTILLISLSCLLFLQSCAHNLSRLGFTQYAHNRYDWKRMTTFEALGSIFTGIVTLGLVAIESGKASGKTIEEMVDIATIDAASRNGTGVSWLAKEGPYSTGVQITAVSEKEPIEDIQFVYLLVMPNNQRDKLTLVPKRYIEMRALKKEGSRILVWKQPLYVEDGKGRPVSFFSNGGTFEEVRAYYQQNKDKMNFTELPDSLRQKIVLQSSTNNAPPPKTENTGAIKSTSNQPLTIVSPTPPTPVKTEAPKATEAPSVSVAASSSVSSNKETYSAEVYSVTNNPGSVPPGTYPEIKGYVQNISSTDNGNGGKAIFDIKVVLTYPNGKNQASWWDDVSFDANQKKAYPKSSNYDVNQEGTYTVEYSVYTSDRSKLLSSRSKSFSVNRP